MVHRWPWEDSRGHDCPLSAHLAPDPLKALVVADYAVTMPDPRHSIIPEYFRAQLPGAPPELFDCLDLRRYLGESE